MFIKFTSIYFLVNKPNSMLSSTNANYQIFNFIFSFALCSPFKTNNILVCHLPEKKAQQGSPFSGLKTFGGVFWQYSDNDLLSKFRASNSEN